MQSNRFGKCQLAIISGGKSVVIDVEEGEEPILAHLPYQDCFSHYAYEIEIGLNGGMKLHALPEPVGGHEFPEIIADQRGLRIHTGAE